MRKKTPLPEIQEEGLTTPLRRGSPAFAHTNSLDARRFNDMEAGNSHTESYFTSHVEMAAALVDQVTRHIISLIVFLGINCSHEPTQLLHGDLNFGEMARFTY